MNTTIQAPTSVAHLRAVLGTEDVFENGELDEILTLQKQWQKLEENALEVGVGAVDRRIGEAVAAYEGDASKRNFENLKAVRLNRQALAIEYSALNDIAQRTRDTFAREKCAPPIAVIMRRATGRVDAIVAEQEAVERAAADRFSVPFRPSDTLSAVRALANRLHLRVADLEAGRASGSPRAMIAELIAI
ncbi:MAG: hypothetical protein ACYDH9_09670 [Limisphaerales bacterium]